MSGSSSSRSSDPKKSRGRPPTYVWEKDEVLTEAEKRLKVSIEKRRERQKKSYYKKKNEKQRQSQSPASSFPDSLLYDLGAAAGSSTPSSSKNPSRSSPLYVVRDYYGYP